MSDIQRWECYDNHEIGKDDEGDFVTYADHVAAVAEAVRKANEAWQVVYTAGVQAARDAVAAAELRVLHAKDDALAAIDADCPTIRPKNTQLEQE